MACRFAPCSTTNTLYRPFAGNSEMRQLIGDYSVQELSDSAQQHGGLGYINLGNSTVDGGAEQRHHPRAAELLPNSQKCEKPVYSVGGDRSVHNRNGKTHLNGGEGGIRTPGRFNPSTVFKTAAFDHSATSPMYSAASGFHQARIILNCSGYFHDCLQ